MQNTVQAGVVAAVHEDHRRAIAEFNAHDFSIQSFTVKEAIPLGNHYHERKEETFVILAGSGNVTLQSVQDGSPPSTLNLSEGAVIKIPPYVAHTFVLKPGSKMICFSSAPFDPNDKDMIDHKLV